METDLMMVRQRLVRVARLYAQRFQADPDVRGVVIYGSLSRGGLTPFSDVDLAVIREASLPSYWCEHRVVDGVKADAIFQKLDDVRRLATEIPVHLYFDAPVSGLLLESLLLGSMDTILYDPTGEVRRVKQALNAATSYDRLAVPAASEWIQEARRHTLRPAQENLAKREWSAALMNARQTARFAQEILRLLAVHKEVAPAAETLGIPEVIGLYEELDALGASPPEAVERVWSASQAVWAIYLDRAYRPILDRLVDSGVEDPEHLELVGAYRLFWPGDRLHELGRVIAEVDLSHRWSRHELDRGRHERALQLLWACDQSCRLAEQWKQIGVALKDHGHVVSGIVEPLAEDTEIHRLGEALDAARDACKPEDGTQSDAERAVELAHRILQAICGAFPCMEPQAVAELKIHHARDTNGLADALSQFEAACADGEDLAGFPAFCDAERHSLLDGGDAPGSARDVERLRPLSAWRLTAAEAAPDVEMVALGPDSGWTWANPSGKSTHAFRDDGSLEITPQGAFRLQHSKSLAPTLCLDLSGDFAIEASVKGWGGLLVRDESGRLAAMGKPIWEPWLDHEVRFEAILGPEDVDRRVIGRGRLPAQDLYLRLRRTGARLSACCSTDGEQWYSCGVTDVAWPDPLQAGVYAQGWAADSPAVQFGSMRLWGRSARGI